MGPSWSMSIHQSVTIFHKEKYSDFIKVVIEYYMIVRIGNCSYFN